jgi:hypothetical protein
VLSPVGGQQSSLHLNLVVFLPISRRAGRRCSPPLGLVHSHRVDPQRSLVSGQVRSRLLGPLRNPVAARVISPVAIQLLSPA